MAHESISVTYIPDLYSGNFGVKMLFLPLGLSSAIAAMLLLPFLLNSVLIMINTFFFFFFLLSLPILRRFYSSRVLSFILVVRIRLTSYCGAIALFQRGWKEYNFP